MKLLAEMQRRGLEINAIPCSIAFCADEEAKRPGKGELRKKKIGHWVVSVHGLRGCWYGNVDIWVMRVPVPLACELVAHCAS